MAKFKLLAGKHCEGKDEEGNQLLYYPGDVIESTSNLLLCNGKGGASPKFELVDGDVSEYEAPNPNKLSGKTVRANPVKTKSTTAIEADEEDGLDGLSKEELKKWAEADSINISSAKTKQEIIDVIREATAKAV